MKHLSSKVLGLMLISAFVSLTACDDSPSSTPQPSASAGGSQPAPGATAAPSSVAVETGPCGTYVQTDNALTNGDFEAPTVRQDQQIFPQGSQFTNWTVDSGNITFFTATSVIKPSGNQVIGFAGSLSQTISTFPNKPYFLTFCYTAAPGATSGGLAVSWNGQTVATLPLDPPGATMIWKGVKMTLPPVTGFRSALSLNGQSVLVDTVKLMNQP